MRQATNPAAITAAMDEVMIGIEAEVEGESVVIINNDFKACRYICTANYNNYHQEFIIVITVQQLSMSIATME